MSSQQEEAKLEKQIEDIDERKKRLQSKVDALKEEENKENEKRSAKNKSLFLKIVQELKNQSDLLEKGEFTFNVNETDSMNLVARRICGSEVNGNFPYGIEVINMLNSRCPANAMCIRAGEVAVILAIYTDPDFKAGDDDHQDEDAEQLKHKFDAIDVCCDNTKYVAPTIDQQAKLGRILVKLEDTDKNNQRYSIFKPHSQTLVVLCGSAYESATGNFSMKYWIFDFMNTK